MSHVTATRRGLVLTAIGAGGALGATTTARAQDATTHRVEMTDELVFDPDTLTIAPGDTVVWETVGSVGHSVTAYEDEIPDDAAYFASDGLEDESSARRAYPAEGDVAEGETYEHTFEVEGRYDYFCIPHETVGMLGTIAVGADAGGGGGDATEAPGEGGGGSGVAVPPSARVLGVATTVAMVAVLGLAYVMLRYGGYDR